MCLEFATQAQDLHIDAAIEDVFVHASRLQQLLTRERPLWSFQKGNEEGVLALSQCNRRAVHAPQASTASLEPPSSKRESSTLRLARSRLTSELLPTQYRAHPRKQFAQAKGFRYVVVRAKLQADNPIDLVEAVARSDDDGYVRARAYRSQKVETVVLAQAKVQDDETRLALREVTTQLAPVGGRACGKSMFLQVTRDHPSCCGVVIDDQDVSSFAVAGLGRAIHVRSIGIGFNYSRL
jgi:hypothetical protein